MSELALLDFQISEMLMGVLIITGVVASLAAVVLIVKRFVS